MDKYVNKIKTALNASIQTMLSKKSTIKLVNGYDLAISRVGDVAISDFAELKLLSFTGERKFEVDGMGTLTIWEKTSDGAEVLKTVDFQFRSAIVRFDDNTRNFEVSNTGIFSGLNFTR